MYYLVRLSVLHVYMYACMHIYIHVNMHTHTSKAESLTELCIEPKHFNKNAFLDFIQIIILFRILPFEFLDSPSAT